MLYYPSYVISFSVFFLCPVTDISATVAPIGVKFCMKVHIGPVQKVSPFGAVSQGNPNILNFWVKFLPLNRKYLENGKSHVITCQC